MKPQTTPDPVAVLANRYGFAERPPNSLNELVSLRAAEAWPGHPFVTFLADGATDQQEMTFQDLETRGVAVARLLVESGLKLGDRVMIMLPTGLEFITTFFGVLLGGMVPVPVYPPARLTRLEHYLRTLAGIAEVANCGAAVADERLIPLVGDRLMVGGGVMLSDADIKTATGRIDPRPSLSGDPCFLQFTSGTTQRPRGVLLLQEQVMAQLQSYAQALDLKPGEGVVSWLPLYHDLGLIGKLIASLYARCHLVLLSPVHFLKRPFSWLNAISRFQTTHSAAPNFAYQLCVRKCPHQLCEREGLDLKSWDNAGMGGEPVSMATAEAFRKHFKPFGFRGEVLNPCYGMAENTLVVTGHRRGEPLRSVTVSRRGLSANKVLPADDDTDAFRVPGNGRAFPGVEVIISDPEGHILGERQIGEIQVTGPSLAPGYFNDPEASRAIFLKRGNTRWLHTGDIGFLSGGDLFICGRQKEMLIVRGHNYHPQDFEAVVNDIKGLRPGSAVAFAEKTEQGTERAVMVAELDPHITRSHEEIRGEMKEAVAEAFSLNLDQIELVPKGTIPKTSSGKLQRGLVRQAWKAGEMASFLPPGRLATWWLKLCLGLKALIHKRRRSPVSAKLSQVLIKAPVVRDEPLDPRLEEALRQAVPEGLPENLHQGLRLDSLGIDSVARMELWMRAEELYVAKIPDHEFMASQTLGDVQELLEDYRERQEVPADRPVSAPAELPVLFQKLLKPEVARVHEPAPTPWTARLMFGTLQLISGLLWGMRTAGTEHLPPLDKNGFLLAGNHLTYLDAAWVRNALPSSYRNHLTAVSWAELPGFTRIFLRQMDIIPVDPTGSIRPALEAAIAALEAHRLMLIFPEGARSHTGKMGAFRPGIAIVSLVTQRPIMPFRIHGGFEIYPRESTLPSFWPRFREDRRLRINFGPLLKPPALEPAQAWKQAEALMQELRAAVEAL